MRVHAPPQRDATRRDRVVVRVRYRARSAAAALGARALGLARTLTFAARRGALGPTRARGLARTLGLETASTYLAHTLGLARDVADEGVLARAAERFRQQGIRLPTFAQLASPLSVPAGITEALAGVDRMAADAHNLFRVHWYNPESGERPRPLPRPEHMVLPTSLTGKDIIAGTPSGSRHRSCRPATAWPSSSRPRHVPRRPS